MVETQQKILLESEELFLKYGVRSISMDDIAGKLGMSKKTLYNVFENKKDLINNVILNYIRREKEATEQILSNSEDAIDEILNIARHVLKFLRQMKPTTMYDLQKYYPESWRLIESLHLSYIESTINTNLKKGMKQGLYRKNMSTSIISKLYVAKTQILNDEKIFPNRDYKREELFMEFIKYHLHGIVSQLGFEKLEKIESV